MNASSGAFIFSANAEAGNPREPEPWVVAAMPQDNDSTETELPASFQASLYKRRPDIFSLVLRRDDQRKTHDFNSGTIWQ